MAFFDVFKRRHGEISAGGAPRDRGLLVFENTSEVIKAEKILKEARSKASGILREGNEEARKILSAKVPLDEVKAECEQIINQAREEADKEVEESKKKAAKIRTSTSKKVEGVTKRIVGIITGAS